MKTELLLATATEEPSSSSNNNIQFGNREKMEKLLGLCLTRQRLLLLERNIGADSDQLKQTLAGCFVRVPVQGRPMLAAIRSVKDSCQIEWAKFGRRLRLTDSIGYFEFDQVDPEMAKRKEMKRWCQRREQKGHAPLTDEFIETKLAQLSKFIAKVEEPQRLNDSNDVSSSWIGAGTSAQEEEKENIVDEHGLEAVSSAGSDQSNQDEEFGEDEGEDNISMKAEELPELPNVDGLVQNRELLAQVLLPCKEFLKLFSFHLTNKVISRNTTGCLMAFRIAGKRKKKKNSDVIVDEIEVVEKKSNAIRFKLGHMVKAFERLVPVDESEEITDQVFDQWLQRLAIRNEPLPDVQAKYARKQRALKCLAYEAEWTQQVERLVELPDIGRIIVTGREVQLLADHLALANLNRVLTGCFVTIKMEKYMLESEKQPEMYVNFVVPITRVVRATSTQKLLIHFDNSRIPIRHSKTGEPLTTGLELQNMGSQTLKVTNKLILKSLLMMKELEIPWPSEEEIAHKSTQLDAALAKAASASSSHSSTSTPADEKTQHHFPGPSGASTSVLPHSLPNKPVQTKQQRQKRKRRIGTTGNDDAGKTRDEKRRKRAEGGF